MKKIIFIIIITMAGLSVDAQTRSQEEKLNEAYCTGLFKSTDGIILDVAGSNTAGYFSIVDWLNGRVAGLQVYKSRTGKSVPVIRGGVPAVFVDEVQVSPSYVSMINVNDIAIVKIIKTPFYGGFNAGNGAIAIYTIGSEEEEEDAGAK